MKSSHSLDDQDQDPLDRPISLKSDPIIMVGSTSLSFVIMYARGIWNQPETVVVDFTWPLMSMSFAVNAVFICLFLPACHFFYTSPAYFIRRSIGKILRIVINFSVISFPLFMLNDKIAYLAVEDGKHFLVTNTGEEIPCVEMTIKEGNASMVSHIFVIDDSYYESFSFTEAELPKKFLLTMRSTTNWVTPLRGSTQYRHL